MKICHMTSAHESNDIRIMQKECVSLAKKPENDVYLVARGEDYEYKGVKVKGVGMPSGGRLSRMSGFAKKVYEAAVSVDADIYQFHDPELLPYAKKLKKLGKIVIFDSHENYRKQISQKGYIPKFLRGSVGKAYGMMENKACRYLDAAIFPSDDNPYIGRVRNCEVIGNMPMMDELVSEVPLLERENCVCCIGSLSEARGIRNLIKACHKAGVKLVLGGVFSPASFGEELMADETFSVVDYRGKCDRQEVVRIYNQCRIGADTILPVGQYPNLKTLATKDYEYMIMGMPFITSDFEYNKKIIEEHGCGITVNPESVDDIAKAIRFLTDNPMEAKTMGEKGRKLAEEKYSWENEEKKLYSLYDRLYLSKDEKIK